MCKSQCNPQRIAWLTHTRNPDCNLFLLSSSSQYQHLASSFILLSLHRQQICSSYVHHRELTVGKFLHGAISTSAAKCAERRTNGAIRAQCVTAPSNESVMERRRNSYLCIVRPLSGQGRYSPDQRSDSPMERHVGSY